MAALTEHGEQQRAAIMKAARRLFAAQGFAATGIREVAAEAGVNSAMIAYYFGSKRGLLEALYAEAIGRFFAAAAEMPSDGASPEQRLRGLIRLLVRVVREDPQMLRITLTTLPVEPQLVDIRTLAGLIEGGVSADLRALAARPVREDLPLLAIAGIVLLHFAARPLLEAAGTGPFDDAYYERLPDEIADLVLGGLRGPRGAAP